MHITLKQSLKIGGEDEDDDWDKSKNLVEHLVDKENSH